MLRFNKQMRCILIILIKISIHLMLRFNKIYHSSTGNVTEFQYILCCGSTIITDSGIRINSEFQYILCCGSTITLKRLDLLRKYFNTSYVAVQHFLFLALLLLMQNFNISYVAVQPLQNLKSKYVK